MLALFGCHENTSWFLAGFSWFHSYWWLPSSTSIWLVLRSKSGRIWPLEHELKFTKISWSLSIEQKSGLKGLTYSHSKDIWIFKDSNTGQWVWGVASSKPIRCLIEWELRPYMFFKIQMGPQRPLKIWPIVHNNKLVKDSLVWGPVVTDTVDNCGRIINKVKNIDFIPTPQ